MSHFENEIREQPAVLARLVEGDEVRRAASDLAERDVRVVLTLARGSSDNALTLFGYLAGRYLGLPVASLPPSLFTVYGARFESEGALANAAVPLPEGLHEVTSAFLQVVAGQLLALHLTTSKGLDPDRPRHLAKVTKTL